MTAPVNQGRSLDNILRRAMQARATGRWPAWRWHSTPDGAPNAKGWAREFTRIAENGIFSVPIRDVPTPWGTVRHAMISTPAGAIEPTWAERQRIKNELLGRERVAVEVFPAMSQLVDAADCYHLWLLPAGFALPFGLHDQAHQSPSPDAGVEAPAERGVTCLPISEA